MRIAKNLRKTKETEVKLEINLDGEGKYSINSTLPFLDHMLELFSARSLFDLKLSACGDTNVDSHHLCEDIGICLGEAIKKALKDKKGIQRYGFASLPMDDTLVQVSLDISGRACLVYNVKFSDKKDKEPFDFDLLEDFLKSLINKCEITVHFNLIYGRGNHHIAEAMFKGLGESFKKAVKIDPRIKGVPSTKGILV